MKSCSRSVKKTRRTIRRVESPINIPAEVDRCPECWHAWNEVGPAHYADCRFFSLDDDRDEEYVVRPGDWGYLSIEAA